VKLRLYSTGAPVRPVTRMVLHEKRRGFPSSLLLPTGEEFLRRVQLQGSSNLVDGDTLYESNVVNQFRRGLRGAEAPARGPEGTGL